MSIICTWDVSFEERKVALGSQAQVEGFTLYVCAVFAVILESTQIVRVQCFGVDLSLKI